MGALTLLGFLLTFIFAAYLQVGNGKETSLLAVAKTWGALGEAVRINVGEHAFLSVFAGLWLGAASHTLTDLAGTFIKTGRLKV